MFKMELKFNGRRITSSRQLEREFKKSVETHLEKQVRKAAGAGTRLRKTRNGFEIEGTPEQIERFQKRLR